MKNSTPAIVVTVAAALMLSMGGYAVFLSEKTKATVAASAESSRQAAEAAAQAQREAEPPVAPPTAQKPPLRKVDDFDTLENAEATERAAVLYAIKYCENMEKVKNAPDHRELLQRTSHTLAESHLFTQHQYKDGDKPEFLFKANANIVKTCPHHLG